MVIPMLLAISKRDSWISVLLSGGFILGWLLFIQFIMKKLDHTHLYSWLNNHFGKIIARGLCFFNIYIYPLIYWSYLKGYDCMDRYILFPTKSCAYISNAIFSYLLFLLQLLPLQPYLFSQVFY
ncbi:hypothetical protein ACT7CX_21915 [Bacillus cereus]